MRGQKSARTSCLLRVHTTPDYVKLVPGVLSECPTFELPGEAVEDKALPGVPHFARALRER